MKKPVVSTTGRSAEEKFGEPIGRSAHSVLMQLRWLTSSAYCVLHYLILQPDLKYAKHALSSCEGMLIFCDLMMILMFGLGLLVLPCYRSL
ncbi:hypothetical protein COCSUDRAFT_34115 [Coccomyxa subellipsoidea C-169]|uniref:Uncharacterized protein n=1 Tax=Coccomyxa subellipsoidea (strain C-169) TaxID=574566 RepID=I0YN88_COCSC|nr:hypothetical protein COCSUDRAFT_34115 [Coccomyxa subellipsoidea C-169]EIE19857.1 hypothetical protein COCSUDRAFT_34115 [Coccomyxa subellipsoidea C-169]|eukprot:XP_005644401.1 hypothetical protein COCSUDRAFT_34115 [Coccomyxa subellipsoidea C-169]